MVVLNNKTRIIIVVAVLLSGWLWLAPHLKSESEVTIDNISFGELWMGEELTKEDLQYHVVGIEFWGKWCPPCRAAMPHLAGWYQKYSPQGFILLGFHSTKTETKAEVLEFCKANKITFNIYDKGSVSGLNFSGIPHFSLFDHTGTLVYDGHPMEADDKLAATMAAAPDWLAGEGPYKKLDAIAKKVAARKDLGKILEKLKKDHLNSADEAEKAEAEKLVERLSRFGNRMLAKADAQKGTEPTAAFELYKKTAEMFKGDEIGDKAKAAYEELKNDKAFQDNLKADKELASIQAELEKFKPCNKCAAFDAKCDGCRKKNAGFDGLVQKGKGLIKRYPDSPAARKVKEILPIE